MLIVKSVLVLADLGTKFNFVACQELSTLLHSSLASGSITKSARWTSQELLELTNASIANVLLQHIHVCAASCNILVCAYASTSCICNTALSAVHHRPVVWPCMLNVFITQSREH